jgi:hypothetical protein
MPTRGVGPCRQCGNRRYDTVKRATTPRGASYVKCVKCGRVRVTRATPSALLSTAGRD